MDDKRLIHKIRLRNILSFGDGEVKSELTNTKHQLWRSLSKRGEEIELRSLNVIIGQNASGKSNFVEAVKLLKAAAQKEAFISNITRGGGIQEWIWKGKKEENVSEIEIVAAGLANSTIHYEIKFREDYGGRVEITDEQIIDENGAVVHQRKKILQDKKFHDRVSQSDTILSHMSSIEWFGNGESLSDDLSASRFYTDMQVGRYTEARKAQIPDAPNNFLLEDASNLSLVLNDLEHKKNIYEVLIENLKKFYPRIIGYAVKIYGGTVQLFMKEKDLNESISALRLSDGTLRYLSLLSILCHPKPPRLICIEEPEVGLHPDILPTIAGLLVEASQRTQLIVTTHSDILVSALSETPEAVLVCEHDDDGTHLKRLDKESLKVWLEDYSLGEVWLQGKIGGVRW